MSSSTPAAAPSSSGDTKPSQPIPFPPTLPSPSANPPPPAPIPPRSPPSLRRALSDLDVLVSRLQLILSTPAGTDSLLRTVCFTLQFAASALTLPAVTQALDAITHRLLARALALLPATAAAVASGEKSLLTALDASRSRASALAPRANALSGLISEFRTFVRLWGLLGMYAWGKGLAVAPPKDGVLRLAAWGQLASYTAYQALENRAYLSGKGVLNRDGTAILWDWRWSSRMWMAGVGWEFVRLWRVRQLWGDAGHAATMTGEERAKREKEVRKWKGDLIVNLASAPLTVHYSMGGGGYLGSTAVGGLGMIAGLVGLAERWNAAGEKVKWS